MNFRTIGISFAAAITVATLSACGADDTMAGHGMSTTNPPAASGTQNGQNDRDVTFAQEMIPHHAQALEMAELVPDRGENAQVRDLAERIRKAQDPEINQMRDMLARWGATAPTTSAGAHGGGHEGKPGMMSADEMTKLGQVRGAEFDKLWLGMMIRHHEGAIEMAKDELAKGSDTEAKALAQKIIDGQQAEITEMQDLIQS